jgi:hypothetical protein
MARYGVRCRRRLPVDGVGRFYLQLWGMFSMERVLLA